MSCTAPSFFAFSMDSAARSAGDRTFVSSKSSSSSRGRFRAAGAAGVAAAAALGSRFTAAAGGSARLRFWPEGGATTATGATPKTSSSSASTVFAMVS